MTDRRNNESLAAPAATLPTVDLDAEGAVLSDVLLDPQRVDLVTGYLAPEHFYSVANRRIFEGVMALTAANTPIDIVTLTSWLRGENRLHEIGGPPYLYQLADATPAIINIAAHAKIVRDKWRLRRMRELFLQHAATTHASGVPDVQAFFDGIERELFELVHGGEQLPLEVIGTIIQRALMAMTEARERGENLVGLPTGLLDLDRMTGGLYPGDLYVMAGRPGSGKSAVATSICLNIATAAPTIEGEAPIGVALFSLEMPREQIAVRCVCSDGGIDNSRVRHGKMTTVDWEKFTASSVKLNDVPIWIDDTPGIGLMDVRARVRRLQRAIATGRPDRPCRKLGLVAIDYLQLMRGKREKGDNREQEVAAMSKGLKEMAKELQVPVIAVAQLNREVEKTRDKRPLLSHLRECVAAGTLVFDCESDELRPIEQLIDAGTFTTRAWDPVRDQVVDAPGCSAWLSPTAKQTATIYTVLGRQLRASLDHPILCATGEFVPLGRLRVGQWIQARRASWTNRTPEQDVITRIELGNVEQVYDVTVPRYHAFVANDIIVHNSGAVEQDADAVWLLYRAHYYDKQAPANEAELIIGKQRNGPTGTVKLHFDPPSMKFSNALDGDYDAPEGGWGFGDDG